MPPVVSVVIPTARRAALVRRAVASVLAQTMGELELIVVIDGPDPEASQVLGLIADRRLRVIRNERSLGPGGARNSGAAIAQAPWLAFLDDDDEWLPQKLQRQLAVVGSSEQRVIVTCLSHVVMPKANYVWPRRLYDNSAPLDEYLYDRRSLFLGDAYLPTSSVLMSSTLFSAFKFSPLRCHEDEELWLRATKLGGARIITLTEPLVIVHAEEERSSLARDVVWRDSLDWADRNRRLIGGRAYSGFCLAKVAAQAARAGEFFGLVELLWRAFRHGRPRPVHLAVCVAFVLIPMSWRRRVRRLLSRGRRGLAA